MTAAGSKPLRSLEGPLVSGLIRPDKSLTRIISITQGIEIFEQYSSVLGSEEKIKSRNLPTKTTIVISITQDTEMFKKSDLQPTAKL